MRLLRYSEDIEDVIDAGHKALQCPSEPLEPELVYTTPPSIPGHVVDDADLGGWKTGMHTASGSALFNGILHRPSNPGPRQAAIARLAPNRARIEKCLTQARTLEQDVLWVLNRPAIGDTWPLPFLFPQTRVVNLVNNVPCFHELYHMYRLWLSPALTIAYPMLIIFGPWAYVRKKLKWNLTFVQYISFAYNMLKTLRGPAANRLWLTLAVYLAMYLYNVAQIIDMSRMVGGARSILAHRADKIRRFMELADELKEMGVDANTWGLESLSGVCSMAPGFLGVWQWWGKEDVVHSLQSCLHTVAAADVAALSMRCLSRPRTWSMVRPCTEWPKFYGMRHPALQTTGIANPASLAKNMIITGPNAAGKTTYCRAILANVLLAQSLGIACARQAYVGSFMTVATFMRLRDTTGKESLFEAEVGRCVEMWAMAKKARGRVLMILDEPMHATPPTEGAAAAMAFLSGLITLGDVRVLTTTHYAALTDIGPEFVNVSMDAILRPSMPIAFPYELRAGPSFQSIALELLQERGAFTEADGFIESAVKMKRKISNQTNKISYAP